MTAHPKTDPRLIQRAKMGDQTAFRQLIEQHAGLVHAIARAWLKDAEAVEDLVQEVFLRVWLNLSQLRDPERLPAWLGRMTRNLAQDWLRRGNRRSHLVPMVPLEEQVHDVPDTASKGTREMIDQQKQSDLLTQAIDRLPPLQREVVLLHFVEELKQREIAERLGVNAMMVSRLLKRATTAMKSMVEPKPAKVKAAMQVSPSLVNRTAMLIAAAGVMSSTAKAGLAAAAAESAPTMALGAAVEVGAATGLVSTIAAKLAAGGSSMFLAKAAGGACAVLVGVAGYNYVKSDDGPRAALSEPVVQTTLKPAAEMGRTAGETISLTGALAPGQTWVNQGSFRQNQEFAIPNMPQPMSMNMQMDMSFDTERRVTAVDPIGVATVEERVVDWGFDRVVVNGQELDFDTMMQMQGATGFDMEAMMRDMVTTYRLDPQGAVLDLSFDMGEGMEGFEQMNQLGQLFQCGSIARPASPVAVGDSWSQSISYPGMPDTGAEALCTLDRLEEVDGRQVAVIVYESTINMNDPVDFELPEDMFPVPMNIDMTYERIAGEMKGEIHYVPALGRNIREVMDMEMNIGLHMRMETPEGPQEMTTDIHQRTHADIESPVS